MKNFYLLLITLLSCSLSAQNALNFDGVNDRVSCGNGSSVQLSGTAITLEAWIYPTGWQTNVWQGNIINKESNSPDYGYMLRCGAGGKLNFNMGNGSWKELTSTNSVLTLNTWQHVAATYDGSKIRLYVNGIPVDSLATSVSFSSASQNLTVGNWSDASSNRTFIGSIDEARIWNVARTKSEIVNAMGGEFCAPPAGLVACYRLNEGTASGNNSGVGIAYDFTSNGNNGTLSGFALSGATSNWVAGANITPGSNFMKITATGCNDYKGPTGLTYDSSGVYLDTLQNIHGCDSVIETTLTLKKVNIMVTANSTTLKADQNNATYRWMDCNNNFTLVTGGTQQTFTPPNPNGSYAVSVNFNGCTDTSACYSLQGVGINENQISSFEIYPNPSKGIFTVSHRNINPDRVTVFDFSGKQLFSEDCKSSNGQTTIDLSGHTEGVYFIKIETKSALEVKRLLLD